MLTSALQLVDKREGQLRQPLLFCWTKLTAQWCEFPFLPPETSIRYVSAVARLLRSKLISRLLGRLVSRTHYTSTFPSSRRRQSQNASKQTSVMLLPFPT